MTAICAYTFPDRVTMYTDGTTTDAEGKIRAFGPKVYLRPDLDLAYAIRHNTGDVGIRIEDALGECDAATSQVQWLRSVGAHLRHWFVDAPEEVEFDFIVGAWIHHTGTPAIFALCHPWPDGRRAFALEAVRGPILMPWSDGIRDRLNAASAAVDLSGGHLALRRASVALMEAQRAELFTAPNGKACFTVGGFVQETTIGPEGIRTAVVHRWDDRAGRPIGA